MNIKSKKGFVLAASLILTIIMIVSSIGLYASVYYGTVETRVHEVEYVRGYYASLAGLRYAAILLRDPSILFNTPGVPDGENYELPRDNNSDAFITTPPFYNLTLTITERPDGLYDVRAVYAH